MMLLTLLNLIVTNGNNKKRNDMEEKFLEILIQAQSQNYHLSELQKELCILFDVINSKNNKYIKILEQQFNEKDLKYFKQLLIE